MKDDKIIEITNYLINKVKLKPDSRYDFIFIDGTGFHGFLNEFAEYACRRFAKFPDDSYEVIDETDFLKPDDFSYEIYPPSHEDEVFQAGLKKDWRF